MMRCLRLRLVFLLLMVLNVLLRCSRIVCWVRLLIMIVVRFIVWVSRRTWFVLLFIVVFGLILSLTLRIVRLFVLIGVVSRWRLLRRGCLVLLMSRRRRFLLRLMSLCLSVTVVLSRFRLWSGRVVRFLILIRVLVMRRLLRLVSVLLFVMRVSLRRLVLDVLWRWMSILMVGLLFMMLLM